MRTDFSVSNLWYMKKWYCFYTQKEAVQKLQRPVAELESEKLQRAVGELERAKFMQNEGTLPSIFTCVPWGQHVDIITKCHSIQEALFYIRQVVDKGLSRPALQNCIKADLYSHQGKIVNNFTEKLPDLQSKLVQDVLKENYDFGGFAFIGRQKEVLVGGRSRKIDLLFYHIRLRCFVACELKAKPFEPEFVGKLNFYVNAVDELLKAPEDNPTIGLLICSNMDSTDVQWSFRGLGTPMGVATYNNIRIKDALPSKELLEERMRLLQKEMHTTKRLIRKKGE